MVDCHCHLFISDGVSESWENLLETCTLSTFQYGLQYWIKLWKVENTSRYSYFCLQSWGLVCDSAAVCFSYAVWCEWLVRNDKKWIERELSLMFGIQIGWEMVRKRTLLLSEFCFSQKMVRLGRWVINKIDWLYILNNSQIGY